jgi:lipoprotein-anchoring transpeptidase ErfK/SrfK
MYRSIKYALLAVLLLLGQAASARDMVVLPGYPAGSIVVRTSERTLFFVMTGGQAIRYPVGVGRAGMAWHGHAFIDRKLIRPSWGPPDDIARANPRLPWSIPGGAPNNPMGEAALGLNKGNYAIHGTNDPNSIGHFVSHGCIRMFNADIMDLYARAPLGTQVYVLP